MVTLYNENKRVEGTVEGGSYVKRKVGSDKVYETLGTYHEVHYRVCWEIETLSDEQQKAAEGFKK